MCIREKLYYFVCQSDHDNYSRSSSDVTVSCWIYHGESYWSSELYCGAMIGNETILGDTIEMP